MFEIVYTKPLLKASTPEYREELEFKFRKSMSLFTELDPKTVKFGLRNGPTATAHTYKFKDNRDFMLLGVNCHDPIHFHVMGHEIIHFIQEISDIPAGETQCDIWTLVKSELFLDRAPYYLHIPRFTLINWQRCKHMVRKLCIESIEVRKTNRQYIKWLESELIKLDNNLMAT